MSHDHFRAAVERVGGQAAFRAQVGISVRTFYNWSRDGVPLCRVKQVAGQTGLSFHELRPDLFTPTPSEGKPQ